MKTHHVKKLALAAACLAFALTASACSSNKANNDVQSPSPSAAPSETASAPPASESPSASPDDADGVKSGEGEYTGMMDGHSIEIIVDGQPTPFQIGFEIADQVSDWEMGTPVEFQYTEEQLDVNGEQITQLTIIKIDQK